VFGNNVEDRMGKLLFALFYLAGGIIASLGHIGVNAGSTVPVVGASGAIAAVMGAYLVWYPNVRIHTLVFIVIVRLRAMWVLLYWFVLQFFTDPNEGVAWMAHVTGFVYGVIVALVVSALTGGYRSRPAPQRYYY
jgi:membrane associated rhomboid family serine protease